MNDAPHTPDAPEHSLEELQAELEAADAADAPAIAEKIAELLAASLDRTDSGASS